MGRNTGNKSAAPSGGGNSMWVGVLVGVMAGVGMAAGVAWYLMKSPSPFVNKEQPPVAKSQPDTTKPATPAAPATVTGKPNTTDGKPRFEFYKVLTDKTDATAAAPTQHVDKPKPVDKSTPVKPPAGSKPVPVYEAQILQAGSFSSVSDAENLRAKLALLGVEARIQPATIPDKGVWYRVRLGPYKTADEMTHARGYLKQNGVDSTPMRAQ